MGGKRRDPDDYIFKKDIEPVVTRKRKANQPETPPKRAPMWIPLEELVFGKGKGKGKEK